VAHQPFEVVVTEKSLVRRLPGRGGGQFSFEGWPALRMDELRPGDVVLVAATQGNGPGMVTAVALRSGVEPVLAAAPLMAGPLTGHWDFNAVLIAGAR
jgi:hypothetical protein